MCTLLIKVQKEFKKGRIVFWKEQRNRASETLGHYQGDESMNHGVPKERRGKQEAKRMFKKYIMTDKKEKIRKKINSN